MMSTFSFEKICHDSNLKKWSSKSEIFVHAVEAGAPLDQLRVVGTVTQDAQGSNPCSSSDHRSGEKPDCLCKRLLIRESPSDTTRLRSEHVR